MGYSEKRHIKDVLYNRTDISPFITHLTKDKDMDTDAKAVLTQIITDKALKQSCNRISPVVYGSKRLLKNWSDDEKSHLLSAICFTETPLKELSSLIEISQRQVNLRNYGIVFLKEKIINKNVSPVLYLNNYDNKINDVIHLFGDLIDHNYAFSYDINGPLSRILPLFSTIGNIVEYKIDYSPNLTTTTIDFYWEREWRYPYVYGDFVIDPDDVFTGLCDNSDIEYFENLAEKQFGKKIIFIDPEKDTRLYMKKLDKRIEELDKNAGIKIKI